MGHPIHVEVNGKVYEREVEARTLLVHFLREALDLTGTNVGCETSLCGACTVLIDGAAVKSCTQLAVQAEGQLQVVAGLEHHVGVQVQSGSSLSNAMAGSGAFPTPVVRMVGIGESTGNLTETLSHVAEFYDQDVDGAIDAMIGMIEPALTAVMGLIMAWIALAVFGPIYDNLGQLGG